MKKIFIALLAALILFCGMAMAAEEATQKLSILTEEMLMESAGLSVHEWETEVARMRSEGLEHQLSAEDLKAMDPEMELFTEKGTVYAIQGTHLAEGVKDVLTAYRCAYQMVTLLGGADETMLSLWSVLGANDRTVYVFQQVHDGLTVVASTMRLVTDEKHNVIAVFSSLSGSEPVSGGKEITAEAAEAAVAAYLEENQIHETILSEYTNKVIIPIESDVDSEEILPDQIVWAVYTRNPRFGSTRVVDLPYLAHYVQMDGTYLYNNTVTRPRDMASLTGYSSVYTFEFMEAAEWKGEVHYANGDTRELTVPVMRDSRTNVYYLGDVERKIVIGDFAAMAYGDEIVKLLVNAENEWEDADLITYANFIKAWDFYAKMGWIGPDGMGTPTLLLRKLCLENGEPIENACYIGKSKGWQCFAYSELGNFGQCLDILAHEFTHCVTSTLMNTNLYQDDWGAINEAMSDILGNICELSYEDTDDKDWLIGENCGKAFRSMSDPHLFGQPEYVWDVFYVPHTDTPNDVNDRGGVHSNSSLLNLVASKLCLEGGMTLEEARDFFMMVAYGMTPKTDYPQMATLLRWALRESGNSKYADKLNELIVCEKLVQIELPTELPEGQYLAILELPEGEVMADPNWACVMFQINTKGIMAKLDEIFSTVKTIILSADDQQGFADLISELLSRLKYDGLVMTLNDPDATEDDKADALINDLSHVLTGLASQHFTWRQAGTNRMPVVLNDDWLTIHIVINMDPRSLDLLGLGVLIGDQWIDAMALASDEEAELDSTLQDESLDRILNMISGLIFGESKTPDKSQFRTIPNNGLENIKIHLPEKETDETQAEAEQPEAA